MTEDPMDFIRETDEIIRLENKVKKLENELKKYKKPVRKSAAGKSVEKEAAAAKSNPASPWNVRFDAMTARNAVVLSEIFGPPVSKRRR